MVNYLEKEFKQFNSEWRGSLARPELREYGSWLEDRLCKYITIQEIRKAHEEKRKTYNGVDFTSDFILWLENQIAWRERMCYHFYVSE